MVQPNKARAKAFSLVELLIVIGLLGLILGLLMSAVQHARASAARVQCQNNLHQISLACHSYESKQGCLPPASTRDPIPNVRSRVISLPWPVTLLPELEHSALYQEAYAIARLAPSYENPPHSGLTTVIGLYVCPADTRLNQPLADEDGFRGAYCSYVGIAGKQVFAPESPTGSRGIMDAVAHRGTPLVMITDGTSNTIHFSESPPYGKWLRASWYTDTLPFDELWTVRPCRSSTILSIPVRGANLCTGPFSFGPGRVDNPCDSHHLWSLHPNGANFAFADGSVRFMTYEARDMIPDLATIAGGETVDLP